MYRRRGKILVDENITDNICLKGLQSIYDI